MERAGGWKRLLPMTDHVDETFLCTFIFLLSPQCHVNVTYVLSPFSLSLYLSLASCSPSAPPPADATCVDLLSFCQVFLHNGIHLLSRKVDFNEYL